VNAETVLYVGKLGEEFRWVVTGTYLHLHDSFRELQLTHGVMRTKLLQKSLDDEMGFAVGPRRSQSP
jgi:monomeric isocitrate dehydrogenase